MSLSGFIVLVCVLLLFTAVWFGLSYWFNPSMNEPDGFARVTGNCGDTMEIGIKVEQDRVVETSCSTDGCSMSRQCVEAAARLARDKKISDIKLLNMSHVVEEVGRIPDSHLHCAQLAEITLQRALDDYSNRQRSAEQGQDQPARRLNR